MAAKLNYRVFFYSYDYGKRRIEQQGKSVRLPLYLTDQERHDYARRVCHANGYGGYVIGRLWQAPRHPRVIAAAPVGAPVPPRGHTRRTKIKDTANPER